jgi:nitronate monooxygenase
MIHSLWQQLPWQHPIVQAPMAGSQGSALALAVCQAGGMGSLPGAMLSPEALAVELKILCDQAAGPWNVKIGRASCRERV